MGTVNTDPLKIGGYPCARYPITLKANRSKMQFCLRRDSGEADRIVYSKRSFREHQRCAQRKSVMWFHMAGALEYIGKWPQLGISAR